jgi:hypothetical protein
MYYRGSSKELQTGRSAQGTTPNAEAKETYNVEAKETYQRAKDTYFTAKNSGKEGALKGRPLFLLLLLRKHTRACAEAETKIINIESLVVVGRRFALALPLSLSPSPLRPPYTQPTHSSPRLVVVPEGVFVL